MSDDYNVIWTILDNPETVARMACERIVQASKRAIAERGEFHIVLAGGSTPERTYELLATADCDWSCWHLWFSDERCLPREHPDRNSMMVERVLTNSVAIPSNQIHIIQAEHGPETAASHYDKLLAGVHIFDMVLLGIGEDGHTASLFPDHKHPEGKRILSIYQAPKFPAKRVSMSAEMLGQCRIMMFIITGEGKSSAVNLWRQGKRLPVSMMKGVEKTEVIIDKEASLNN